MRRGKKSNIGKEKRKGNKVKEKEDRNKIRTGEERACPDSLRDLRYYTARPASLCSSLASFLSVCSTNELSFAFGTRGHGPVTSNNEQHFQEDIYCDEMYCPLL